MIAPRSNWHQQVDVRSLEMHQLVAQKIRRAPVLFQEVEAVLKRWLEQGQESERASDTLSEWEQILGNSSREEILELISSDSEEAARLRQSSPFVGILTDQERKDIFARYEALRG